MSGCVKIFGALGLVCLLLASAVAADPAAAVWNPFGDGLSLGGAVVVEPFEGDLVAAGFATGIEGDKVGLISRWDGDTWQAMGEGTTHWVQGLVQYDGQLIAVAEPVIYSETDRDTLTCVVAWDGSDWVDLGFGKDGDFRAVTVWDNKLVVGGHFDTAAGVPAKCVAVWDGANWSGLGEGLTGRVQALLEFEGDLYAGGDFQATGDGTPINYIARWNGASWEQVGTGFSREVCCLFIYDGKLTAGGRLGAPLSSVAAWDGAAWSRVGDGTDLYRVRALTEFQGELIAGGQYGIRRFDGANWLPTIAPSTGDLYDFEVFDGKLVAAGKLGLFEGVELNRIAWRESFDQDADGVYDINDNCIWVDNPAQENADGDLLGDLCDDCYGCETSVYLHHVSGLKNSDTVYAGTPVRFYFAVSGFPENPAFGLTLWLKLHSPDGAVWDLPVLDTVSLGWYENFHDDVYFPTSGVTGTESDTLGFAAVSLLGAGLPAGFSDVAFYVTTEFSADQEGKTICIDSCSSGTSVDWLMSYKTGGDMVPYWDGPHCFTIYSCCRGMTGDIANDNGEVDVTDIGAMIDHLFLTLEPLACFSSGNINYPGSGYSETDDIVDIVDLQLLIDNQFLTLSPLPPCP